MITQLLFVCFLIFVYGLYKIIQKFILPPWHAWEDNMIEKWKKEEKKAKE